MTTLAILMIAAALLAAAVACGGDDDNASATLTPTAPASDGAPTATASTSATSTLPPKSPVATNGLFVVPSRDLPAADHDAIGVFDVVGFLNQELNGSQPSPVPCAAGIDITQGIIDCTAEGYGTIAVDPIPTGASTWTCRALLRPDNTLFAASCNGGDPGQVPTAFIYAIEN